MVIHRVWYYQRFWVSKAGVSGHISHQCVCGCRTPLIMNDSKILQAHSEDWPRVSRGDIGRRTFRKTFKREASLSLGCESVPSRCWPVEVGMLDSSNPGFHI